jgi:phosphocarrier protein HPr
MVKTVLKISNKLGLHARASAKLTKMASGFASEIHLTRNGRRVNAKSIMGVMMLAAGMGSDVELEVEGADEQAAAQAIASLVEDKFGEGQ